MTNIEVAVGLLITRAARQTRPDSDQEDADVDKSFKRALRVVHELVVARLGSDPALERLQIEASRSGEVRPRTRARLVMSLEDAVEDDPGFARKLEHAVNEAQQAGQSGFEIGGSVVNQITGNVSGRVIQARDIHGSITFDDGPKGN